MKDHIHKSLIWTVILSETSHVFCCVLPTLFSVMGLLTGLGFIATLPPFMVTLHNNLHHWEIPMIVFSGGVLAIGWGITRFLNKVDCHDTGCCHGPCSPSKNRALLVMKIATILFIFNVLIYVFVHRSGAFILSIPHERGHDHAQHVGETLSE